MKQNWLLNYLKCLGVLEVMVTSTRPGNHENERLSGYPEEESKSYSSKMKQNNSTEFSGHSFVIPYNKNGPHIPPPDPETGLVLYSSFSK